jgi:RNA 3'-terminal phosphate cyclase (GTP)
MLHIDGSHNEGGGQIVRTAIAFATLLDKPVEVNNIRANRPQKGLKNQHLHCIKALQQLCHAKIGGAELGSEKIRFLPENKRSSKIKIDIGSAGSITLMLQSLLIPCLFSEKSTKIEITGGTDVKWSPQIDYFREIILPHFYKYAQKIELSTERRGYYPKGNGKVILKIKPKYTLKIINESNQINLIEQGTLVQIKGISHASTDLQKAEVAERQAKAAKLALIDLKVPLKIEHHYAETDSIGSGITLWAMFAKDEGFQDPIKLGSDELGEKGVSAEDVGKKAAEKLLKEISSGTPVDQHLADNLVPLMALVKGQINTSKITNHTLTNIYTIEQFLGKIFEISNNTIKTIN